MPPGGRGFLGTLKQAVAGYGTANFCLQISAQKGTVGLGTSKKTPGDKPTEC